MSIFKDGEFKDCFGSSGSDADKFNGPQGIALNPNRNPNGNLYKQKTPRVKKVRGQSEATCKQGHNEGTICLLNG